MELAFKEQTIPYTAPVYRETVQQEVTAEIAVPDTLPDARQVLYADGTVCLRGKEAENGSVTVTGALSAGVLFSGIKDTAESLDASVSFTRKFAFDAITEETKSVIHMTLRGIEVRIVHARKLLLRAQVQISILCCNAEPLQIVCDAVEKHRQMELCKCEKRVNCITDVQEKTFVLSDTYRLPAGSPPAAACLKSSVWTTVEDVKRVGNRVLFRGRAFVRLLYRALNSREICPASFSSEYSQIMEIGNLPEDSTCEIVPMLTGVYFEAGEDEAREGAAFSTEMHFVAQCVIAAPTTFTYISDMYSNRYDLQLVSEVQTIQQIRDKVVVREMFQMLLDTPEPVKSILDVQACPGQVTAVRQQDTLQLKAELQIVLLYTTARGELLSTVRSAEVSSAVAISADSYAFQVEKTDEIYAAASPEGVDIRIPFAFTGTDIRRENLKVIRGASFDPDQLLDLRTQPSLILLRAGRQDTLWALAKKYHSTMEQIRLANNLEEDAVLPDQFLMIPRQR